MLSLWRTLARSAVNGPGERFVLWVQGCPLACPGCWNPESWSPRGGQQVAVSDLRDQILATPGIEGVTFTGGEPFAQAAALSALAADLQAHERSVFIFTGHTLEELTEPAHQALLAQTDVLVAGRYLQEARDLTLPWRSSTNQRVHHLTERYREAERAEVPRAEVHLHPNGQLTLTGFPEDDWRL